MQENLTSNTQGQFLIAMPGLNCSVFSGSLIYMLEHNDEGAIGLIVNHPIAITTNDLLRQIDSNYTENRHPQHIFAGGPVATQRGFVLHHPGQHTWQNQTTLTDDFAVTVSADILEAMAKGDDVEEYMIVLGYSGWSPQQLEQELADNAWLTVAATPSYILSLQPEQRLNAAAKVLGIDYQQLTGDAGHA